MSMRNVDRKDEVVAVAIDNGKSSQYALKWAVDHLLKRGQSLTLLHVKPKATTIPTPTGNVVPISDVDEAVAKAYLEQVETQSKKMFLPFRCFCTRKDIQCNEVIVDDTDVPKAIVEFVDTSSIEILILGAPSKSGLFKRFKVGSDVPNKVSNSIPDFCTVYIISKGKILGVKSATRSLPARSQLNNQSKNQCTQITPTTDAQSNLYQKPRGAERTPYTPRRTTDITPFTPQKAAGRTPFTPGVIPENMEFRSPFSRPSANKSYESSLADSDISFVSSGRPSIDRMFPSFYDNLESSMSSRFSNSSDFDMISNGSPLSSNKSVDMSQDDFSSCSQFSSSTQSMDDHVEAEMSRLKLELKQTMDMYSSACKEALTAKAKAKELHRWKVEEQQKKEESQMVQESALALAEKEKEKCGAATEAAEAAKRIAELEAHKRNNADKDSCNHSDGKQKTLSSLTNNDVRYRKYTIEEVELATNYFTSSLKIGEGGYGPVYKCYLDHTPVAIKVLRPDAAQGRSQFNQEVEVLSCIRHPNMVLLLGACPEYGCLVYEYMANGSLEDCLFRRGNSPVLSWQLRFQIAAEIGTALLFLHQAKPEPIVHRDLKPANILLDRNYVSKISDVGLARLVPPSVADKVTQYHMTSTAGTFCYIDPEYQQTGMLGTKSDVYSFGILLLQIVTAKAPMGLTHQVERAIEKGTFSEILDPAVLDWPVKEALKFTKLALQCAELRRKDRPDLGKVVLPELNRLRILAEGGMQSFMYGSSCGSSPANSQVSTSQDVLSESGYASSKSRSSISSSSTGIR